MIDYVYNGYDMRITTCYMRKHGVNTKKLILLVQAYIDYFNLKEKEEKSMDKLLSSIVEDMKENEYDWEDLNKFICNNTRRYYNEP